MNYRLSEVYNGYTPQFTMTLFIAVVFEVVILLL